MTDTETHAPFTAAETALLEQFRQGSRRALARLITRLDDGEDPGRWLAELGNTERAARPSVVGITGPPGAGKSSIVGCLLPEIRRRNLSVAVLAVDPESPFTGGAILGDRIRMGQHTLDDNGIYIRSISSRGSAGGLSRSTRSICRVLAAFGFDLILLETVGAGQAELSVMDAADLVLLVLVPGTGDTIQWEKAGQVEIADVFALNKADLEGIDALEGALRSALEQGFLPQCPSQHNAQHAMSGGGGRSDTIGTSHQHSLWDRLPPIIRTVANQSGNSIADGMPALLDALLEGLKRVEQRPDLWRSPVRRRLRAGLEEEFSRRMRLLNIQNSYFDQVTDRVRSGELSLENAIQQAWKKMSNGAS